MNTEKVGEALLPEYNEAGTLDYTPYDNCKVDGKNPAVMALGCCWDYENGQYHAFSGGEFDEPAMWIHELVDNGTMNELPFFYGGYCKFLFLLISRDCIKIAINELFD